MPTKEEVGRRVRMARFRRDMTLKEVATRSGMSATHISEIERGKTSPTIGALQRIASALDERPAHFVEERDAPLAVLTRKDDRTKVFVCDEEGHVHNIERINADPPWATTARSSASAPTRPDAAGSPRPTSTTASIRASESPPPWRALFVPHLPGHRAHSRGSRAPIFLTDQSGTP